MNKKLVTNLVLLGMYATLGSSECFAQTDAKQPTDSFLLKRNYSSTDNDRYKTTYKVEGALSVDITVITVEKVKEIKPDGTVTVELKLESGKVNFGGSEQDLPGVKSGQTTEFVYDKSGKEIKKTDGDNKDISRLLSISRFSYIPGRALKVGEEVKYQATGNDTGDKLSISGKITVVGLQKGGLECPEDAIKCMFSADSVSGTGNNETKPHTVGTLYIEPMTGKHLVFSGKVTGANIGHLGEMTITFKRELVRQAKQ